jgi:peptidoglycan/LPS O-acetylase OafA/YrhL
VFLFFVISGFLITKHTLRRHGTLAAIDLRNFYVRRASRILPFLILLVTVLSILHLCGVPNFTIDTERQSLLGAVCAALFLHLNWYEASTGYLPGAWDVMWSLSIEEVFYIGFPLICVVLRKPWLLAIGFFGLALSLPFTRAAIDNWMWMSKAYLPGMAAIAMGIIAAMLAHRIRPPRWVCLTLQWGGMLGIATGIGFRGVLLPWLGHGTMLLLTTSTALSLIGMDAGHQHHTVRPLPGLGWLRSFGRLSYEVYLTHMFVVFGVQGLVLATLGENLPLGYLWYLPTLLLSWVPGYIIYRYYTGPTDRYLRGQFQSLAVADTTV